MPQGLAINDVTLSARRRSLPTPMFGHREVWFDVAITVENRGDEPLHVVRELRTMSYDEDERRLTLLLREGKPATRRGTPASYTLPPPATITVPPGEAATITVPVPAKMSAMQRRAGEAPSFTTTDIRAMRRLRVEIAAGTTPMGVQPGHDAHALQSRIAKWGKTFTHETDVKPDTRE